MRVLLDTTINFMPYQGCWIVPEGNMDWARARCLPTDRAGGGMLSVPQMIWDNLSSVTSSSSQVKGGTKCELQLKVIADPDGEQLQTLGDNIPDMLVASREHTFLLSPPPCYVVIHKIDGKQVQHLMFFGDAAIFVSQQLEVSCSRHAFSEEKDSAAIPYLLLPASKYNNKLIETLGCRFVTFDDTGREDVLEYLAAAKSTLAKRLQAIRAERAEEIKKQEEGKNKKGGPRPR